MRPSIYLFFFFFNDTATTEIYTLSLHDALPILNGADGYFGLFHPRMNDCAELRHFYKSRFGNTVRRNVSANRDRKSTRLNSSHSQISYAVFCLKKKKKNNITYTHETHAAVT